MKVTYVSNLCITTTSTNVSTFLIFFFFHFNYQKHELCRIARNFRALRQLSQEGKIISFLLIITHCIISQLLLLLINYY